MKAEEFVDNYDLNGAYARYVYRIDGMRIWNQSENGFEVREWGPTESGKVGTLVLRYRFSRPVETSSLRVMIRRWRDDDETIVSVSTDDDKYTRLTTDSMTVDPTTLRARTLDLTPYVAGEKTVYIRFELKGTRLNTHITTPSLMRTAADRTSESYPHVFEFRAQCQGM